MNKTGPKNVNQTEMVLLYVINVYLNN